VCHRDHVRICRSRKTAARCWPVPSVERRRVRRLIIAAGIISGRNGEMEAGDGGGRGVRQRGYTSTSRRCDRRVDGPSRCRRMILRVEPAPRMRPDNLRISNSEESGCVLGGARRHFRVGRISPDYICRTAPFRAAACGGAGPHPRAVGEIRSALRQCFTPATATCIRDTSTQPRGELSAPSVRADILRAVSSLAACSRRARRRHREARPDAEMFRDIDNASCRGQMRVRFRRAVTRKSIPVRLAEPNLADPCACGSRLSRHPILKRCHRGHTQDPGRGRRRTAVRVLWLTNSRGNRRSCTKGRSAMPRPAAVLDLAPLMPCRLRAGELIVRRGRRAVATSRAARVQEPGVRLRADDNAALLGEGGARHDRRHVAAGLRGAPLKVAGRAHCSARCRLGFATPSRRRNGEDVTATTSASARRSWGRGGDEEATQGADEGRGEITLGSRP